MKKKFSNLCMNFAYYFFILIKSWVIGDIKVDGKANNNDTTFCPNNSNNDNINKFV